MTNLAPDGFREETGYDGDAIAVHTPGCDCYECLTGAAVAIDSWRLDELAAAVAAGREIVNLSGAELTLVITAEDKLKIFAGPRKFPIIVRTWQPSTDRQTR